ncbi:MAG: glycosyltransferase family 39 protein [Akkermansiaceae bacterium]|nr:glycosyltransferase family 39 protein [Akkermansiaceae bacterium]
MSNTPSRLDTGIFIRRSLFFVILIALTLANLMVLFRGLNAPHAMDQAQIAREISRGSGFTTKMIRPIAYSQAVTAQGRSVSFLGFEDTYHSPLNPILNAAVFKIIGADKPDAWKIGEKEMIYPLDRIVATVCTVCFLLAIGVNYLLISRIFDAKIAGVCALLMLFCEIFWSYSLSGLPQMLMLLLFSCGLYFAYRAVEVNAEGKGALGPAAIAGVFFTLLALTHWMTVWIALGYIIYVSVALRPRGLVGVVVLLILLVPAIGIMLRNQMITDSPFGTAFLTLYNGLGGNSESFVMRSSDISNVSLEIDGIVGKTLRTVLLQVSEIIPLLAGIVIAPLFFLALLHPFKRPAIANFRWAILLMWLSTAFGLSIFGVSTEALDPNQLHLLFAPIMAAYGLAFVSIMWSRLDFVSSNQVLRNVHHIVVVGVCALPMIFTLQNKIMIGIRTSDTGGVPHWPPYFAPAFASDQTGLKGWVTEKQTTFADQPWAVAWYGDRISVWLPTDLAGFEKIENAAASMETPAAGIVISPVSHSSEPMSKTIAQYDEFAPLVFEAKIQQLSAGEGRVIGSRTKVSAAVKRYPYPMSLLGADMLYYSDRPIRVTETTR